MKNSSQEAGAPSVGRGEGRADRDRAGKIPLRGRNTWCRFQSPMLVPGVTIYRLLKSSYNQFPIYLFFLGAPRPVSNELRGCLARGKYIPRKSVYQFATGFWRLVSQSLYDCGFLNVENLSGREEDLRLKSFSHFPLDCDLNFRFECNNSLSLFQVSFTRIMESEEKSWQRAPKSMYFLSQIFTLNLSLKYSSIIYRFCEKSNVKRIDLASFPIKFSRLTGLFVIFERHEIASTNSKQNCRGSCTESRCASTCPIWRQAKCAGLPSAIYRSKLFIQPPGTSEWKRPGEISARVRTPWFSSTKIKLRLFGSRVIRNKS